MLATATETARRYAAINAETAAQQPAINARTAAARELLDTLLELADDLYPDDTVDVLVLSPRQNFFGAFVENDAYEGAGRRLVPIDDDLDDADVATLTETLRAFAVVAADEHVTRTPSGFTQLYIRRTA